MMRWDLTAVCAAKARHSVAFERQWSIDKFLDVSVIMRLLGAPKLVFLCNSLEGLGRTFNSIGQPAVVFDRKLADDLVYASRSVISELRLVIYVLTGRIFMAHVRPLAFSFCAEEPA